MATNAERQKRRDERKRLRQERKRRRHSQKHKSKTLVSSGGKVWWKGHKSEKFDSVAEAKRHTHATYNRKGKYTGLATKSEAKRAQDYWQKKVSDKAREYRKRFRLEQAAAEAEAAKTKAEFYAREKSAIETEMQRRYALAGSKRRGPRTAALAKSRREAWGKKLAESRKYEGETWFGKIPKILGTSQATPSLSRGRRLNRNILRELNGRRKSPARKTTRKKTGGQVL